jgi:hypothetical protein
VVELEIALAPAAHAASAVAPPHRDPNLLGDGRPSGRSLAVRLRGERDRLLQPALAAEVCGE